MICEVQLTNYSSFTCHINNLQFVSTNGVRSKLLQNNNRIPQGLILVPVLLLLYVNYMPQLVKCIPRRFADDACLIISNLNLSSLTRNMNEELERLSL